ncbi:MAG: hypothetical protein ACI85I_002677 [Arenicella sp.]|jgi:hypothetical protein
MTKIKVNINKPDPTPETIRKYKNYGGFISDYQQLHTPNGIYKMWREKPVKFSMIIVFICLFLIYLLSDWEKPEKKQEELPKVEKSETVMFTDFRNCSFEV